MKINSPDAARQLSLVALFPLGLPLLIPTASLAQEPHLNMPDPPGTGSASSVLCFLLIGILLGVCGQVARSAVGIKKEMDAAKSKADKWAVWFDPNELWVSLLLGAVAGAFAAIGMMGEVIDKRFLLACIAAGYAGSDFIQGFMKTNLPASSNSKDAPAAKTEADAKATVDSKAGPSTKAVGTQTS